MEGLSSPHRTLGYVKTKKMRGVPFTGYLTFLFAIILFANFAVFFNFYFYLLTAPKIIIMALMFLTFIFTLCESFDVTTKWKDKKQRKSIFVGKWLLSLREVTIKVILPSICILLFFHLSGYVKKLEENFMLQHPLNPSPFAYTPLVIEGVLIIVIVLLQLGLVYLFPFWGIARFFTIKRYNFKKDLFEENTIRPNLLPMLILLFVINILTLIYLISLERAFLIIKHGDIHNNYETLYPILKDQAYLILLAEALLLLIMNIFFFFDGRRAFNTKDFWPTFSSEEQTRGAQNGATLEGSHAATLSSTTSYTNQSKVISRFCSSCSSEIEPEQLFCGECGSKVEEQGSK